MEGKITTQKTVWCGLCDHWEYLDYIKMYNAKAEAREKGWKKTRKYGWICPTCLLDQGK